MVELTLIYSLGFTLGMFAMYRVMKNTTWHDE